MREQFPPGVGGICSNCDQWQDKYTGDCVHGCAKRGFAERAPIPGVNDRPSFVRSYPGMRARGDV